MYSSIVSCSGSESDVRRTAWLRAELWADRLSILCFGVLALVMLATLPDYGLTYDEEPHVRLGERVLEFYTGGFIRSGGLTRSVYGAGFDLGAALLRRLSPWDEYRTNHIACVFVAQVGLLGTWKLGRWLAGPVGGLSALLFLVLTPVYYGHQFNNPKDIPFATGYVWGLYAIARLITAAQAAAAGAPVNAAQASSDVGSVRSAHGEPSLARDWPRWLGLALVLGLAMSVRIAGGVLIAYLALFLVLLGLDFLRLGQTAAGWRWLRSALLPLGLALLASWVVMLVFWPGALANPLQKPADAFGTLARFTAYDSPTLLRGKHISSNHVPWDYLPTYFALQLPELTSAAFLASVLGLCVRTVQCLRRRLPIAWCWWLLVVAVSLPPAYAIVRHSTLYNGLRHFLFLMPPISVLAGAGFALLLRRLVRDRPRWVAVPALLFALFTLDQVGTLWRLHPHQHVSFNRLSGGAAAAVDRYETEYYGSVYQELHARLIEEVWTQHRETYLNRTFLVAGCGSKLFFTRNLPLNFQYLTMRDAGGADYFASYVRDDCLLRFRNRPLVTQVERDGAVLALARDMKARARPKAAPP